MLVINAVSGWHIYAGVIPWSPEELQNHMGFWGLKVTSLVEALKLHACFGDQSSSIVSEHMPETLVHFCMLELGVPFLYCKSSCSVISHFIAAGCLLAAVRASQEL